MMAPYKVDSEGDPELTVPDEPGAYLGKSNVHNEWEVIMIIFGDAPFLKYKLLNLWNGEEVLSHPIGTFYFSEKIS